MAGYRPRYGRPRVTNPQNDLLARLDPGEFEALIATHYRRQGYEVERVGRGGARFDGGIDLKLRRGSEYVVVQCKRENVFQVTHTVGHQLLGVMCTQGATGAIVVNAGEFTPYAHESARGDRRLTLVDGDEVRRWFPDLAVSAPTSAPKWIPVGDGPRGRLAASPPSGDGIKFIGALVALGVLFLWQCNRPAPVRNAPARAANPILPVAAPARGSTTAGGATVRIREASARDMPAVIHDRTPEELAEWKRRNKESMDILRESTPELGRLPPQR